MTRERLNELLVQKGYMYVEHLTTAVLGEGGPSVGQYLLSYAVAPGGEETFLGFPSLLLSLGESYLLRSRNWRDLPNLTNSSNENKL